MPNLRDFTIRARLLLLGALAIITIVAMGLMGVWSLNQAERSFARFAGSDLASLADLAELRGGVGNLRRFEKDMFINVANAASVKKYRADWQAASDKVDQSIQHLQGLPLSSELRATLAGVGDDLRAYRAGLSALHQRLERGEIRDTLAANTAFGATKASIHSAEQRLTQLAAGIEKEAADGAGLVKAEQGRMIMALGLAMAATVMLVAGFTWLNLRSILLALQATVNTSQRLGQYDLREPIACEGRDEATALMQGLKHMQGSLREVVSGVRQATAGIATASREVAAGSLDLSQRTEQAGSNLQSTAAAMAEITASVRNNAEAARQASQLAGEASGVAHQGGQVVGQVVSTMARISESSRKIGDIIAVIDGIAFQTNILALNAAVEAARAGEQGRGFAVVAAEVRTLAQRSAEAAKEIKGLINASAESVSSGASLVAQAGQTMQQIVGSIERVSQIVSEISQASGAQSGGIGQVSQAIQALDQMTQQNAALVEQSAAAAHSLQDQAQGLSRSVAVFKID